MSLSESRTAGGSRQGAGTRGDILWVPGPEPGWEPVEWDPFLPLEVGPEVATGLAATGDSGVAVGSCAVVLLTEGGALGEGSVLLEGWFEAEKLVAAWEVD